MEKMAKMDSKLLKKCFWGPFCYFVRCTVGRLKLKMDSNGGEKQKMGSFFC